MKKSVFSLVLISIFIFSTYSILASSETQSLACEWSQNQVCSEGKNPVLYALTDFPNNIIYNSGGNLMSSKVSMDKHPSYQRVLCCDSPAGGELDFSRPSKNQCSAANQEKLLYFTDQINAKIGVDAGQNNFNIDDYSHTLCVERPEEYASLDIQVDSSDSSYKDLGYECLFRISDDVNGVVSSCNAVSGGGQQYDKTVWARFFENIDSIQCNSDCTSELDDRVYSICGQQLDRCSAVPQQCDGSLYGAWVDYNQTHEVQCSASWDNYRTKTTGESFFSVTSSDDDCTNLISKKHSVMIDNQPVTMNVYVCSN